MGQLSKPGNTIFQTPTLFVGSHFLKIESWQLNVVPFEVDIVTRIITDIHTLINTRWTKEWRA